MIRGKVEREVVARLPACDEEEAFHTLLAAGGTSHQATRCFQAGVWIRCRGSSLSKRRTPPSAACLSISFPHYLEEEHGPMRVHGQPTRFQTLMHLFYLSCICFQLSRMNNVEHLVISPQLLFQHFALDVAAYSCKQLL